MAWPFQVGILDFMSDDRIEELAVKKSKRVGYSKMITAFVCYNIAHRRRKQPCAPPRTLGVHVWAAYSPQRPWSSIVDEYEKASRALAEGDAGPMTTFTNETLGEAWELKGEGADQHVLQARAEPYALHTVPVGGLMLFAGVDVQHTWWDINIWAFGRGLESWVVDHHIIEGNPTNDADWEPVHDYLQRRYPHCWNGITMGLTAISIDSSDQTQAVYNWVSKAQSSLPNLRAIKGKPGIPIVGAATMQEVNYRGRKISRGIKLWGVDNAKDLLLGQLSIKEPGLGYLHFSNQLPREWFEQLTAEHRVLKRVNGKDILKWIKRRARNEVLDGRNYAMHAAMAHGIHKGPESKWRQLEQAIQPAQDLFNPPVAESAAPASPAPVSTPMVKPVHRVDDNLFAPISLQ